MWYKYICTYNDPDSPRLKLEIYSKSKKFD